MENNLNTTTNNNQNREKKQKFKYSPENPPPFEVLESKVFAVHATPIFPKNGVLKTGARDIYASDKWQGDEPPSFRPTIHFALGELVQKHSDWSWEKYPYAVISPLKNLKSQLVNISPNDTFILGDLQLQEGDILLVPKGTDVSKLPRGIEIKEYDLKTGLRQTVNSTISEKQGWHIQMRPEGVANGSVAYIEDVEINDSKFFQSFFEKYPHISFGTHLYSERGDAFRFGVIEQTLNNVMKNYSDHWLRYSTIEVLFHRSLILHHLEKLQQTIKNSPINPQALAVFEEKKAKLRSWLNIINCDLEIRQRLGKTFTGVSEPVQRMVRARRDDPAKLQEFVNDRYLELPDAVQESELSPAVVAEMLASMSVQELEQFKTANEAVFRHISLPEFYSHYAVRRWIVIKNEQAQSEGLDQLLAKSLEQLSATPKEWDGIFGDLKEFLNEDLNRLEVALTILRNPTVQKHLVERFGMQFKGGGPANLREVIAAHPKTRVLFESQELSLSNEQNEAYQLLEAIGQIHKPKIDLQEALRDFIKANSLALYIRWLRQNLATILKPMNTARKLDDILAGTELTLYEVLRRDVKPVEIWRRVGLDKEYQRRFLTDSDFWNSDKSLLEIYRMLKANHK